MEYLLSSIMEWGRRGVAVDTRAHPCAERGGGDPVMRRRAPGAPEVDAALPRGAAAGCGHGGKSGRFERLREKADEQAFMLLTLGACAVGIRGCKSASTRPFERSISSNMTRYYPQSTAQRDGGIEFSLAQLPTAQAPSSLLKNHLQTPGTDISKNKYSE